MQKCKNIDVHKFIETTSAQVFFGGAENRGKLEGLWTSESAEILNHFRGDERPTNQINIPIIT